MNAKKTKIPSPAKGQRFGFPRYRIQGGVRGTPSIQTIANRASKSEEWKNGERAMAGKGATHIRLGIGFRKGTQSRCHCENKFMGTEGNELRRSLQNIDSEGGKDSE